MSDSNPFELVDEPDDDGEDAPARKKPEPKDPPGRAADEKPEPDLPAGGEVPPELDDDLLIVADPGPEPTPATPAVREDPEAAAEVQEIELDDKEPPAKEPPPAAEEPSDGGTVRMSLADVVSAWDEEAPSDVAEAVSTAGPPAQEQSAAKRIAIMVLVIVAVLAVIVVLFAACTPVAHADEARGDAGADLAAEAQPDPRTIGVDWRALEGEATRRFTRRDPPPGCCWKDWVVHITPYGFLAGVKGDVFADGERSSIEIPFEDLIDKTAAGGMLNVSIGYRRWCLELDGLYGHLEDTIELGSLRTDVEVKQYQVDIALGYVLVGRPFGTWSGRRCCPPAACPCPRLVAYLGARYCQTDLVIRIQRPGGPLIPAIDTRASDTSKSWKPFLGLAWSQPLGRRWTLRVRGDVGSGEAHDETKTDVRLEATVSWQFHKAWALKLGYRLFNQESLRESGGIKEGTDLLQHGPLIGIGFNF